MLYDVSNNSGVRKKGNNWGGVHISLKFINEGIYTIFPQRKKEAWDINGEVYTIIFHSENADISPKTTTLM